MEELYILLAERFHHIEEMKHWLSMINKMTPNLIQAQVPNNLTIPHPNFNDWSKEFNRLKKIEKKRLIKENELIEILLSIKVFDLHQRQ